MSETVLEPSQASFQPSLIPIQSRPVHRFTPANAREMARKSWQARKQAELDRERALLEASRAEPEPDSFQVKTLGRVREQLAKSLSLLRDETDPASRDRLAGSITKLEEVERRLSDRRLPAIARTIDKPGTSSRSAALLLQSKPAKTVQRQEQE